MITAQDLEMAALAAGRRIAIAPIGRDAFDAIDADEMRVWRPHTDIADAARLAVRLDMQVESSHGWMCATVAGWMDWGRSKHDGTQPDKEHAYCKAVTLCAAAIGRQMRSTQP